MALLAYTINGIVPVFAVIFVGIFLNKLGFFSENTKDEIIKLVFYVGTPCLIFMNIAPADIYSCFDFKFEIFSVLMILLLLALSILFCSFIKEPSKKGAVVQIAYRSNFAIIGMPLAINLLSKEGVTLTAVTLSFAVVTYNISAVILLSYYGGVKRNLKSMLKGILTNPLIAGTLAGLLFSLLKLPIPVIFSKTLSTLGDIATCMGLIIIGASITLEGFKKNKKEIFTAIFLRNVFAPFLFIGMGLLFGYRNDAIMVLAIMSSAPAAINSFVMAKKMNVSADISAFGVSLTSIFSIFGVFISVYLIKLFGFA